MAHAADENRGLTEGACYGIRRDQLPQTHENYRLLEVLDGRDDLQPGQLIHPVRPAAAGLQADRLGAEPGYRHCRRLPALSALWPGNRRMGGPAGPQARDDSGRHWASAGHRLHPGHVFARCAQRLVGLWRGLCQYHAQDFLRCRRVRGHSQPGRSRRSGDSQRAYPGQLLWGQHPRAAAGGRCCFLSCPCPRSCLSTPARFSSRPAPCC
jgi:hypothetical protein